MSAEEVYAQEVRGITQEHRPGTAAREMAKREAWERFEVALYQRDGSRRIIHRMQEKFAVEYYRLVEGFYNGTLEESHYQGLRIATLQTYASRLFKLGLVSEVFDRAWIQSFADRSLAHERALLPVPREFTGWTNENAVLLCNPLRDFSKAFFLAVHVTFGAGRLKDEPEIYGGIDAAARAQEDEMDRVPRLRVSDEAV